MVPKLKQIAPSKLQENNGIYLDNYQFIQISKVIDSNSDIRSWFTFIQIYLTIGSIKFSLWILYKSPKLVRLKYAIHAIVLSQ